jgi:nitrogenase subunit NifH
MEPFAGGSESGCQPKSDSAVLILVADDLSRHVVEVEDQTVIEVSWERGASNGDDVLSDGLNIVGCLHGSEVDISCWSA